MDMKKSILIFVIGFALISCKGLDKAKEKIYRDYSYEKNYWKVNEITNYVEEVEGYYLSQESKGEYLGYIDTTNYIIIAKEKIAIRSGYIYTTDKAIGSRSFNNSNTYNTFGNSLNTFGYSSTMVEYAKELALVEFDKIVVADIKTKQYKKFDVIEHTRKSSNIESSAFLEFLLGLEGEINIICENEKGSNKFKINLGGLNRSLTYLENSEDNLENKLGSK